MALLGWDNAVDTATLVVSAAVAGMGPEMLRVPLGNAATALQTPQGVTALALTATLPAARAWKLAALSRTNLTSAAALRLRVYAVPGLDLPAAVATDTNAGANLGPATTRTGAGTPGAGTGAATAYRNAAGSSYVVATRSVAAGATYEVTLWTRRTNGGSVVGNVLMAEYPNAAGQMVRTAVPMSAVAQGTAWQLVALRFTPGSAGTCNLYFVADTGALSYELGASTILQVPVYDSGTVAAGVVAGIGQALHVLPDGVSGRTAILEIADPANDQGCLNIPLAFLGPGAAFNFGYQSTANLTPRSDDLTTRGGQQITAPLSVQRGWSFSVPLLRDADAGWLDAVQAAAAGRRNILYVPRASHARAAAETVLGLLVPGTTGFNTGSGRLRSWSATITERL